MPRTQPNRQTSGEANHVTCASVLQEPRLEERHGEVSQVSYLLEAKLQMDVGNGVMCIKQRYIECLLLARSAHVTVAITPRWGAGRSPTRPSVTARENRDQE